ncbi:MAG: hypothetical protein Q7S98_04725, partial [Deltaproteobacteria bacterium]|nr:hypothetical protein [Deltaproteobacteria bacterium]
MKTKKTISALLLGTLLVIPTFLGCSDDKPEETVQPPPTPNRSDDGGSKIVTGGGAKNECQGTLDASGTCVTEDQNGDQASSSDADPCAPPFIITVSANAQILSSTVSPIQCGWQIQLAANTRNIDLNNINFDDTLLNFLISIDGAMSGAAYQLRATTTGSFLDIPNISGLSGEAAATRLREYMNEFSANTSANRLQKNIFRQRVKELASVLFPTSTF